MTRTHRKPFFLLLLLIAFASPSLAAQIPSGLIGEWKAEASPDLLRIDNNRILQWQDGRLSVKAILDYAAGSMVVRNQGLRQAWTIDLTEGLLRVEQGGKAHIYQRLSSTPPELRLEPLTLGVVNPLPAERIQGIREQLEERVKRDQEVRINPEKAAQRAEVDAENTLFLKELVQGIGWIDAERFGKAATHHAFLLVQHSGDLPLMMAVLPLVERDLKGTEHAQDYALLFDRLQLRLGQKQRYGTQIGQDAEGKPFVKPMEDPEHVEDRWKELGLSSFSQYLTDASRILFKGQPIRLAKPEE